VLDRTELEEKRGKVRIGEDGAEQEKRRSEVGQKR
jgi:hypothetical protein